MSVRLHPRRYADPVLQFIIEECKRQKLKQHEFAKNVGIQSKWATRWQVGAAPTIFTVRAALNALGYDLKVVKLGDPT